MRTVRYRLEDLQKATIRIGRVGENDYTRVMIDGKTVFDEYPRAVPALTVKPPSGAAYLAVVTREDDLVIWDVTDSDLAVQGIGEAQLTFTQDGVVCKSCIADIQVERSIVARGDAPDPMKDWLTAANTALNAIPQALDALEKAKESGEFDGPKGDKGDPGEDGHSPVVTASKPGKVTTISIDGSPIATINDGNDGQDGEDGQDGYSPTATVAKSGNTATITITDKNGTTTAQISDGAEGVPGVDGVSPTVDIEPITGGYKVTITDKNGEHTFDVINGEKGDKGDRGNPGNPGKDFHIAKTFSSIAAMMAYTGTDIEAYDFAMIDTGSVNDPDTGKLYCYEQDKSPKWQYIGDLSGAQGIKGDPGTDGVSPSVSVATITGGHRVSVTDAQGTDTFDVMDGTDGDPGQDGYSPIASVSKSGDTATITITDKNGTTTAQVEDGQDGVSPTVTVTDITDGHRVSITDAEGTETFDVMNGDPGQPGQQGQNGISPTVSVIPITDGHEVTITDATGAHSFDVMNGAKGDPGTPGDPTELIDDTAGKGDTDKTWSADKLADEVSDLNSAIDSMPTEETGQELLLQEIYNTGLTDTALAVIGMIFDNLPQDEPAVDIVHSLELECERLQAIYENWMSERSA